MVLWLSHNVQSLQDLHSHTTSQSTSQVPIGEYKNDLWSYGQLTRCRYHSHVKGQYPDGLRGPVIVHDPTSPYLDQFDEEMVMTLSDWYHDEMPPLLKSFMSVSNPTGAEPVPNSALMNDRQNTPFNVQPGKTYLIHIVNMAAFASQYLWFEDHTMEIVEVDGIWTERAEANMIYVAPAQRYSILLKTKDNIDQNFAIVGSMDEVS